MNRRDFLRPHRLASTAGHVLSILDNLPSATAVQECLQVALLRWSRQAMATTFEVLLPYGTPHALEMAEAALNEIDRLEDQLTVYRDHSEISELNRRAAHEPMPVEPRLFDLLSLAVRISAETAGAFDITAGALTKAWGFYRRAGRVPTEEERAEALYRVGMRHVVLDAKARTLRYNRPGLEINLGSIGKGYALDRAAELLRTEWNTSAALFHGGHSSVYAMGTEPGDDRGWPVGIRHPWKQGERFGIVRLRNRALGTSAATFQHLEHRGRKLGHILDPRTGWPAEGMASATVIAPTAAEADALATAFFILGVEKARAYCETHPGIGAVLMPDDSPTPVVIGLEPGEIDVIV